MLKKAKRSRQRQKAKTFHFDMDLPKKKYIEWIGNDCYLTIEEATRHNTFGIRSDIVDRLKRVKGTLFAEIVNKCVKKKYHWSEIEKKEIIRLRSKLQWSQYDKPYIIHQLPIAGPVLDDPVTGQEVFDDIIKVEDVVKPEPSKVEVPANYEQGKLFIEEARKMLNKKE